MWIKSYLQVQDLTFGIGEFLEFIFEKRRNSQLNTTENFIYIDGEYSLLSHSKRWFECILENSLFSGDSVWCVGDFV